MNQYALSNAIHQNNFCFLGSDMRFRLNQPLLILNIQTGFLNHVALPFVRYKAYGREIFVSERSEKIFQSLMPLNLKNVSQKWYMIQTVFIFEINEVDLI